jgi:signal transduction histidine kinase
VGNISGTGLGLSILKNAVDMHRGSIHVDSKPGQGAAFTVSFKKDGGKHE